MFSITSNPLHLQLLLAVITIGMFLDGSEGSIATFILPQISEFFGTALSTAFFIIGAAGEGIVTVSDLNHCVFMQGFHALMTAGLILVVITIVISVIVQEKEDFLTPEEG